MYLEAREHGLFHVNVLVLPLFPYEEAMKGKTFTFNKECMRHFVGQFVLSMLFSHLEKQPNAELVKVAYGTEFGCKVLMKRFRTV